MAGTEIAFRAWLADVWASAFAHTVSTIATGFILGLAIRFREGA